MPWYAPLFLHSFRTSVPNHDFFLLKVSEGTGDVDSPARHLFRSSRQHFCRHEDSHMEQSTGEKARVFTNNLVTMQKKKSPHGVRDNIHYKYVDDDWFWNIMQQKIFGKACVASEIDKAELWDLHVERSPTWRCFCPQLFDEEWYGRSEITYTHWGWLDYDMIISGRFESQISSLEKDAKKHFKQHFLGLSSNSPDVLSFPDQISHQLFLSRQNTIFAMERFVGNGTSDDSKNATRFLPWASWGCRHMLMISIGKSMDEPQQTLAVLGRLGSSARIAVDYGAQRDAADVSHFGWKVKITLTRKRISGKKAPKGSDDGEKEGSDDELIEERVRIRFHNTRDTTESATLLPRHITWPFALDADHRADEQYKLQRASSDNAHDVIAFNQTSTDADVRAQLRSAFSPPLRLQAITFFGSRFVFGPQGRTEMMERPAENFDENKVAFFRIHRLKADITNCVPQDEFAHSVQQIDDFIMGKGRTAPDFVSTGKEQIVIHMELVEDSIGSRPCVRMSIVSGKLEKSARARLNPRQRKCWGKAVGQQVDGECLNYRGNTSLSDQTAYPELVNEALHDEVRFWDFKTHPSYNQILEHMNADGGNVFLSMIERMSPSMINHELFHELAKQNNIGQPRTAMFREPVGELSPTMLRYLKVASDLNWLFGDLNGKRFAEIGVGYGGLAHTIFALFNGVHSYTLVDLPDVEQLTKKVMGIARPFNVPQLYLYNSDGTTKEFEFDICISNYAFSELTPETADGYINHVLRKCRAGYLTWNPLSIRIVDYVSKIENATGAQISIECEHPLTHPDSKIVLWGTNPNRRECWGKGQYVAAAGRQADRECLKVTKSWACYPGNTSAPDKTA